MFCTGRDYCAQGSLSELRRRRNFGKCFCLLVFSEIFRKFTFSFFRMDILRKELNAIYALQRLEEEVLDDCVVEQCRVA